MLPPGEPPAAAQLSVPLPLFVNTPLALAGQPEMPVVGGKPVALVSVKLDGVPPAPLNVTNAPALPTLTARAVNTPVPVVVVEGAAPAPPPIISAFAVNAAELAQVEPLEKYGMPPEVPATVNASVPLVVTGEPPTEIRPPVKV